MKFVIFDIDGTLTDTKKVEDKCFMKAFKQTFGIDIASQKWEDLQHVTDWGITEEIIQREWNRTLQKNEYERMISNFIELLKTELILDASQFKEVLGARAFFYTLKKLDDFKLGIATGSWESSAKLKLEAIGLALEGICFSNSTYHKSRESITKDVIEQLTRKNNISPEQIVYFGDGEWDYKTCQNLGITFIGIDIENDGKLSKLGANTVFQDYSHCKDIMTALNRIAK